jgi:hypothetical protein
MYVLRFPHAVSQSFPSVFPLLSVGTMATCKGSCHLTGAMLNLAAEAADRARICVIPKAIEMSEVLNDASHPWVLSI